MKMLQAASCQAALRNGNRVQWRGSRLLCVLAYSNTTHVPEGGQYAQKFSTVTVSKIWELHCAGHTAEGQESASVGLPLAVQSLLPH